jgi:NAD-dependent oxidoreductase involved in siderophore biosynthesis
MSAVTFAMVGGGFRSQYFLRIAQALPERFRASGIVVRNPGRATQMRAIWGIPTYPSLEALLGADKAEVPGHGRLACCDARVAAAGRRGGSAGADRDATGSQFGRLAGRLGVGRRRRSDPCGGAVP